MRAYLLFGLLVVAHVEGAAAQGCLSYEPQSVNLSGSVRRVMAYGPPGFGENPRTDAKEPYLDLVLDRPICTRPGNAGEEAASGVADMQILFVDLPYDRSLEGRRVRITGKLMQAETGHHHTKVLILAGRIDRQ